MASTSPQYANGLPQILSIEEETPSSTPLFRPASRRTQSFSSSSRSSSRRSSFESSPFSFNIEESPPYSPISTPLKFIGIPFSWEQTPGIPKHHQVFKNKESSGRHLLPLPPAGNTSSATKKWHKQEEISPKKHYVKNKSKRDPFFAALVECSKDDHDHGKNIWTRSLSDRFGFINMYTCKTTCAVSESIVYLPRATPHYLLHQHRRRSS